MALNTAPPIVAWPDVFEGKGGVMSSAELFGSPPGAPSGTQFGSPTVFEFVSLSPSRMPEMGRQKLSANFTFQAAVAASTIATEVMAKSRAFCSGVLPTDVEISSRFLRNNTGGGPIDGRSYAQNNAIFVGSAVREALCKAPHCFTWLNAAVYAALLSAGVPGGGN